MALEADGLGMLGGPEVCAGMVTGRRPGFPAHPPGSIADSDVWHRPET
jgi:hypothetical protein